MVKDHTADQCVCVCLKAIVGISNERYIVQKCVCVCVTQNSTCQNLFRSGVRIRQSFSFLFFERTNGREKKILEKNVSYLRWTKRRN